MPSSKFIPVPSPSLARVVYLRCGCDSASVAAHRHDSALFIITRVMSSSELGSSWLSVFFPSFRLLGTSARLTGNRKIRLLDVAVSLAISNYRLLCILEGASSRILVVLESK